MSRIQTVRDNWTEIINKLLNDKAELAKYLRFAAGMYKQSFSDAALIYHQNPKATKVATLETWNRLGRLVNKGERSIAVFSEEIRAKHLFDISQTNGKRIPELWKLTEALSAELTDVINQKYGKGCKNIQETIAAMSVDNIRSHLSEMRYATEQMSLADKELKAYQQSFVSAVRYIVSNRCELGSDIKISGGINLSAADQFRNIHDLIRFCDLVQKSARETLLEIEKEIVKIQTKRRDRNELQTKSDRTVSSRTDLHGGQGGTGIASKADRQVGQNVAGVGENRVPDGNIHIHNRGAVADNSEIDRQGGGEPISGNGQEVSTGKSPSADIHGNSVMGKDEAADNRTYDNGRNSVSASAVTVENLIECYSKADFNRRWDSYEIAGWILSVSKQSEYGEDPLDHFDRHEADRFSQSQAEEIRRIIKAALENREVEINEPSEKEPVIFNNEIVETSELPPFLDENMINEILKHDRFFKIKREEVSKFFKENGDIDQRTEYMKKVFNYDYSELDIGNSRLGYKADEKGVLMWQGHFLSRIKESHFSWTLIQSLTADLIERNKYLDKNAVPQVYAEELEAGDIISIEGKRWTVQNTGTYLISLKNDSDEHRNIYDALDAKWYDVLNEIGFELISEKELSEPVFTEPKVNEIAEPEPVEAEPFKNDGQLSFFGNTEPAVPVKKAAERPIVFSKAAPNDEMIDCILKCGSNEPKSLERIVAQFQKQKSTAENAEFLKKEFGEDGRGYYFKSQDTSSTEMLSAWFDSSGITAAISNTAFPDGEKIHLSWEQAAQKIFILLNNGDYCSQDIIDRATELEFKKTAESLWYIHQNLTNDNRDKFFIPEDFFKGGFPDSTERIKISMTDKNTLQKYFDDMRQFIISQYAKNQDYTKRHFNNLKETMRQLKDLKAPRRDFITNPDFEFEPKFFITEDEKDKLLTMGSGVADGKFRIEKFFSEEHTAKEKSDFLKNEYGIGGTGRSGFNTWHDSKGLRYTKDALSSNDCEVLMKWNEVAKRIDVLIEEGKYITQSDIEKHIKRAENIVKNHKTESDYDKAIVEDFKKVLSDYGAEDNKSPVEKIIEKAKTAGIPVEYIDGLDKEKAVFMDMRDESYIVVQQVDEGIDYAVYAPDMTLTDGGVWEMDEGVDLKFAASELLATAESELAQISDYEKFIELADMEYNRDTEIELSVLKAEAISNIPDNKPVQGSDISVEKTENDPTEKSHGNTSGNNIKNSDMPVVNSPEKVSVPKNKEPKSGVPVMYHFSPDNITAGGAKSRYRANIEAIKTLQKIESENRFATAEEQAVMAKYVGWGGIQQAFISDRAAESIFSNLDGAALSGWENEQKELLELLSPDEYKAARASTLTSFYTPPDVTDGVYQALKQFGFEGGNVLEPSMGVGNFFAKMPEDMRDNSKLYGVEIDSISGRIAQQLYPNERIQIKGFEKTNFNNNSFDVVIGNIPFGDYKVSDKAYDKHNFKIHDYFAAKAVDKVKPNGVVALVTSKFTMDKQNEKARKYLAERCDLLGAVRLPAGTFKDADSVTTDILFLKKRETMTVTVPDWVHISETEDGIPCNKYFVDNPEMVLGKMAWDERMKGKYGEDSKITTCYADKQTPFSEQLKNAVSKIEGKIETVKEKLQYDSKIKIISADPNVRNFTHTLVDGKLYFRENEIMSEVQAAGKTLDRMIGMHKIREAAMAVINAQAAGCTDMELKSLQDDLNYVYDKFRVNYGNITDTVNERCFRHDDDYNSATRF